MSDPGGECAASCRPGGSTFPSSTIPAGLVCVSARDHPRECGDAGTEQAGESDALAVPDGQRGVRQRSPRRGRHHVLDHESLVRDTPRGCHGPGAAARRAGTGAATSPTIAVTAGRC